VKYKRQTVSIATVNEADYLNDEEKRRWWVVHILSININHGIDLGQLWAEAKSLYEAGVPYWLSHAEMIDVNERNLRYCRQSSVTDLLSSAGVVLPTGKKSEKVQRLNCTEILKKIGIDKATNQQRRECAVWLKSRKFKFYSTKAAYDVIIENEVFAKYFQN
jgi:putative DNA primase/helicase